MSGQYEGKPTGKSLGTQEGAIYEFLEECEHEGVTYQKGDRLVLLCAGHVIYSFSTRARGSSVFLCSTYWAAGKMRYTGEHAKPTRRLKF